MEILAKKKFIVLWTVALCNGFFACSDEEETDWEGKKEQPSASIVVRTEELPSDENLVCSLYVFSKSVGDADYSLQTILTPVVNEETELETEGLDEPERLFRFLFVATPEKRPEIAVGTRNGESLSTTAPATPWTDISIAGKVDSLTIHNYYGITDGKSADIAAAGKVDGRLTRLTGQWMFYFYKADSGKVDSPIPVDTAKALSVFDRIYQIDVAYSGFSSAVTFGEGNTLQPVVNETATFTRTYELTFVDSLQIAIPQTGLPWDIYQSVGGSVRMPGACFLPAEKRMKVKMVFHYYDTTPVNDSPLPDCFTQKEVVLEIPASSGDALSIVPNHFTVNKVALPCDRVIDIRHQSQLMIQTAWNRKTETTN